MGLTERARKRLSEENIADDILAEYIDTMSDRLCLRLGTE